MNEECDGILSLYLLHYHSLQLLDRKGSYNVWRHRKQTWVIKRLVEKRVRERTGTTITVVVNFFGKLIYSEYLQPLNSKVKGFSWCVVEKNKFNWYFSTYRSRKINLFLILNFHYCIFYIKIWYWWIIYAVWKLFFLVRIHILNT